MKGMVYPFRGMQENEFKNACKAEVVYSAYTYLGIQESKDDKEVIGECVRFVKEKFAFIGSGEIRQAFSMCAAGELDVQLRAYYGILTVDLIGKVLSAYREYRKMQVAEIERLKELELQKAKDAERAILNQKAREKNFEDVQKTLFGELVFESWEKIPVYWADAALEILQLTPERKKEIWVKSIDLAIRKKEQEREDKSASGKLLDAKNLNTLLEKYKEGEFSAVNDIKASATAIYSKLLVWENIVK
jgi:hypothetical protein